MYDEADPPEITKVPGADPLAPVRFSLVPSMWTSTGDADIVATVLRKGSDALTAGNPGCRT